MQMAVQDEAQPSAQPTKIGATTMYQCEVIDVFPIR